MNFNQVVLAGRLTHDPELRATTKGTQVCEVGLAVNRYFTSNNEKKKETLFIDVVFWNGDASKISEYTKKGSALLVSGRLELDRWTSQDNKPQSRIRVVAESFQFADSKPETAGTLASESAIASVSV